MSAINPGESEEKLRVRIRAHTEYANCTIEDWISRWLSNSDGCRMLEIGCGGGNYFPTYANALGKNGLIIGFDVNRNLLRVANEVGKKQGVNTFVFQWDFNSHPFPLLDEEVDIVIAPFSAYYANSTVCWVEDSLRILKKCGRMLLLGPTKENAQELYELNELVTNIRSVRETDITSTKLENEFIPELINKCGKNVKKTYLNREIVFPSPEEFARYYFATWLYEKTQEKMEGKITFGSVCRAAENTSLKLNKRVVCIEAGKFELDANC